MDEEHEMVPLDAHIRGSLDAVRTPPERDAGHRRFGAGRQQHQQYGNDSRRSGDSNNSYHHSTTTSDFGRVAERISVRSHHHRAHRDDDDVGTFNFGDDDEVRRQQEHARMQQRNASHRLGNDSNHHHYSSSSYSNNGNTISNSSNGVDSGKYASKLQASGAPITPGASFTVPEQQRLSNTYVAAPSKPDSFLTNLMNVSKSNKAGARPTGAVRIPIAKIAPSVLSASPTRQRLRTTTSVLELGSAPSPSQPSQQTSQSTTTSARVSVAAPSLGWKNTRSRNPASSIVVTQQKPRINLTPDKRPFPEEHPTRTSPRTKRLLLGRDSSLGYSSLVSQNNRETQRSAEETSNNTRSNNNSTSSESTNTISSILRRTTRQRAKVEKKTEGTADQPIDLDSDSDASSPDNKAKKIADPPSRAKAKVKRRAAPTRKIEPHWKEVDIAVIKDGEILEITEIVVWIGRLPCYADVYIRDDCIWICSIRSSVVKWNLMPQLQLYMKDFQAVHLYKYSDDKTPIPGDNLNAAESLMAKRSFIALKAECSSAADQDVLRPFYDPFGSDDSKHFIVLEAPDYDRHGMCFGTIEERIESKHEALVNAIEGVDAGSVCLKALLREPYKVSGSPTDDDQKRSASDYRSGASEEEDESDCFDVQMTYPLPPCSSDIVTITRHDVARLRPEQYLNDNIIDYYFKRLMIEEYAKSEYIQKNVLFLSSHFYSRLRMGKGSSVAERLKAGYKNVATWVTRTDFFSRSMIFIPINKDMHWSLAIILNPKSAAIESPTEDQPPTCITLLDPLGGYHSRAPIVRHLKSFLQLEWENSCAATAKDKDTDIPATDASSPSSPKSSYDVEKVVAINVKPPHQQNSFDCGVYILKYADVILENYLFHESAFGDLNPGPISKDVIANKLDLLITAKAFHPEDITQKRTDIQEFITTDTHKYHEVMYAIAAEQKRKNESDSAAADGEQEGERTAAAAATGDESN